MNLTLTNDFHNTEVTIRVTKLPHILTPSQRRHIWRKLCGIPGCTCGIIRGKQYHEHQLLEFKWEQDIFGDSCLVIYEANKQES